MDRPNSERLIPWSVVDTLCSYVVAEVKHQLVHNQMQPHSGMVTQGEFMRWVVYSLGRIAGHADIAVSDKELREWFYNGWNTGERWRARAE